MLVLRDFIFMRYDKLLSIFILSFIQHLFHVFPSTFLDQCDKGYFCPSGQSVPNPVGFECWAGYYCPRGSATPTPCPMGTFSNSTGNTNMTDCRNCTPGKFIYSREIQMSLRQKYKILIFDVCLNGCM